MSGIAAIFRPEQYPIIVEHIEQLVRALGWRGPDQQDKWVNNHIALGATQLWTTPEAWGTRQPLTTTRGDCIVLDGRLDNRPALIEALGLESAEISDAALLWQAYQQWGTACVDHLVGAFACLIWDATQQTLFAARDPLGMRSLFYHWDGNQFCAASTLHALRTLPCIQPTLNDAYITDYLTSSFMGSFDPTATPLQQIQRLPAGHFLQVNATGLEVTRYWKPWELPLIELPNDEAYVEHFRALFREVVAAHCRVVGPLGSALSGGLDSASAICVAKELERDGELPALDLHTFTILFDQAMRDKAGVFIPHATLDTIGTELGATVHKLESGDWLPMFEELPYRNRQPIDEPFFIPNRAYRNMGYKIKAVQPAVRVLLTGLGADETLATTLFFLVDWMRQGAVDKALNVAAQIASYSSSNAHELLFNLTAAGMGSRQLAYQLQQQQTGRWDMDLGFRHHLRVPCWLTDKATVTQQTLDRLELIPANFDDFCTQAAFERNVLLMGDNVRLFDDQYIGMAAGIEMRHPFYDRRIVEFFLRIPVAQKLSPYGTTKYILRRAMTDIIPKPPPQPNPEEEGEGFLYVYRESLKELWPQFEALFADSRAAAAGFIEPDLFLEALGEKRFGRGNSADTALFATLALEFWLRELEQPPHEVST